MKIKQKRVKKNEKQKIEKKHLDGLEQSFITTDGKSIILKDFLSPEDWWELQGKDHTSYIVLHDAVKRIAIAAGIGTNPDYGNQPYISPTAQNNYTCAIRCTITDVKGRQTTAIGEVSRDNLGSKGKLNPINMAEKRAFDRAVFNHLNITGFLGEEMIQEPENKTLMDDFLKLPDESKKIIAPYLNKIWATKNKKELIIVNKDILKVKDTMTSEMLSVLRERYMKQLSKVSKQPF